MIAQFGQFLLSLAFAAAIWQSITGALAYWKNRPDLVNGAANAASVHLLATIGAFAILAYLMVAGDYSLPYVWLNTNDNLPAIYRFAATWGAHEGSMLLWLLVLSVSIVCSAWWSRGRSWQFSTLNLAITGSVSLGVTAFVVFASNPLDQVLPPALAGRDLNPLLQDPALIFHPPLLYIGYVSTVVLFAGALAGLISKELDRSWAKWLRPFALVSWIFLSCGIALGSYWAYYELGWGGWWFWDPVENASFMPWLLLTALIHALAAAQRSGVFYLWCVLLAIACFALSMLGTFLVRSGVLVSIHSFAADPQRGIMILGLLAIYVIPAIVVVLAKMPKQIAENRFSLLSRESAILLNNALLVVACLTVVLGTLYPLVLEVASGQRISVGEPYFNAVFIPIMLPALVLVGMVGYIRWRQDQFKHLGQKLRRVILIWLIVLALAGFALVEYLSWSLILGLGLSLWILVGTGFSFYRHWQAKNADATRKQLQLNTLGMHLAHLGLGVFVLAASITSLLSIEQEAAMAVGDVHTVGKYQFQLDEVGQRQGENYRATYAKVSVWSDETVVSTLKPEQRFYFSQPDKPMTEAAIDSRWFGDLFVALAGSAQTETWLLRLHIKPGVYWLWLSVLLMVIGGALVVVDLTRSRPKHP